MPDTHLILHVKGTENETTSLPKQVVRQGISQGQITHSQLIWSPTENRWKQVRELPHLLPSQKMAPAPAPRAATGNIPKIVAVPRPASGRVPRVAMKAGDRPTPRVQAQATPRAQATPQVRAAQPRVERSTGDLVVKEDHGSHPVKWLCIILGVVIFAAVGINYLLVDRPLSSELGKSSFSNVTVYAHLGAFMQPNVAVIHIFPNAQVTEANLVDFMVALARSTPNAPGGSDFERIALTSGWTGKYTVSGHAWKQLGVDKEDKAQRKEDLLDLLSGAAGQSLVSGGGNANDAELQAKRDQEWKEFVAEFTHS